MRCWKSARGGTCNLYDSAPPFHVYINPQISVNRLSPSLDSTRIQQGPVSRQDWLVTYLYHYVILPGNVFTIHVFPLSADLSSINFHQLYIPPKWCSITSVSMARQSWQNSICCPSTNFGSSNTVSMHLIAAKPPLYAVNLHKKCGAVKISSFHRYMLSVSPSYGSDLSYSSPRRGTSRDRYF